MKKLFFALLCASFALGASAVPSVQIKLPVNLQFTAKVAGTPQTNGTLVTYPAPTKYSIKTADLIKELNSTGSFNTNGVRIMLYLSEDLSEEHFVLEDSSGNAIEYLDNVMWFVRSSWGETVETGKFDTGTGMATSYAKECWLRIGFDDRSYGGRLYFSADANVVCLQNDKPDRAGNDSRTVKFTTKQVCGRGQVSDQDLVISGKWSAAGTAIVP
jgi:hypothetical protein